MRTQDIIIGEYYRHRDTPRDYYAKAVKIIKPRDSDFFKSTEEKKLKVTVVKCEWTQSKKDTFVLIKYFRPSDLIKITI